jgi:hypothetical protein
VKNKRPKVAARTAASLTGRNSGEREKGWDYSEVALRDIGFLILLLALGVLNGAWLFWPKIGVWIAVINFTIMVLTITIGCIVKLWMRYESRKNGKRYEGVRY